MSNPAPSTPAPTLAEVEAMLEREVAYHGGMNMPLHAAEYRLALSCVRAVSGKPSAYAVVSESGTVDDGRIWRHRDKAERFHTHASRSPTHSYAIVPLYAFPALPEPPHAE